MALEGKMGGAGPSSCRSPSGATIFFLDQLDSRMVCCGREEPMSMDKELRRVMRSGDTRRMQQLLERLGRAVDVTGIIVDVEATPKSVRTRKGTRDVWVYRFEILPIVWATMLPAHPKADTFVVKGSKQWKPGTFLRVVGTLPRDGWEITKTKPLMRYKDHGRNRRKWLRMMPKELHQILLELPQRDHLDSHYGHFRLIRGMGRKKTA